MKLHTTILVLVVVGCFVVVRADQTGMPTSEIVQYALGLGGLILTGCITYRAVNDARNRSSVVRTSADLAELEKRLPNGRGLAVSPALQQAKIDPYP